MPTKKTGLQGTEAQTKTRTLLALWNLGGTKSEVKKSELTDRVKRTSEKAGDYQGVFEQLEKDGAIAISPKNRAARVSLTEQGLQILSEGLKSPKFEYDASVGAKTVNALLKWIRQMDGAVSAPSAQAKASVTQIESYEAFKSEALAMFKTLDKTYNYSGLVPIWHLRRELGERLGREEFNNWMMETQGEQLFYLQSGEARGATDEQKRDSITSEIRGLLFFASKPS